MEFLLKSCTVDMAMRDGFVDGAHSCHSKPDYTQPHPEVPEGPRRMVQAGASFEALSLREFAPQDEVGVVAPQFSILDEVPAIMETGDAAKRGAKGICLHHCTQPHPEVPEGPRRMVQAGASFEALSLRDFAPQDEVGLLHPNSQSSMRCPPS
jgi:hypothetical protein